MSTFDKLSEWESPQTKALREELEALPECARDEKTGQPMSDRYGVYVNGKIHSHFACEEEAERVMDKLVGIYTRGDTTAAFDVMPIPDTPEAN